MLNHLRHETACRGIRRYHRSEYSTVSRLLSARFDSIRSSSPGGGVRAAVPCICWRGSWLVTAGQRSVVVGHSHSWLQLHYLAIPDDEESPLLTSANKMETYWWSQSGQISFLYLFSAVKPTISESGNIAVCFSCNCFLKLLGTQIWYNSADIE